MLGREEKNKGATKNEASARTEGRVESESGEAMQREKIAAQVDELKAKNAEMLGDLQRTRADFENYRKQVEMQKEHEKKAARLATVYKVLPLVDDMDRAIATYPEQLSALSGTLAKTLKELGLEKIASRPGVEFDADVHEAVMATGDGDKEIIVETLRPGYKYEGEVLRAAMVKVEKR